MIEARKEKELKKNFSVTEGSGSQTFASSVEEGKIDWDERRLSSPYDEDGDDDDIIYGSLSEGKVEEERTEAAMPPLLSGYHADPDDDPFVRHINEVLGPMGTNERRDPLRDYLDNL